MIGRVRLVIAKSLRGSRTVVQCMRLSGPAVPSPEQFLWKLNPPLTRGKRTCLMLIELGTSANSLALHSVKSEGTRALQLGA